LEIESFIQGLNVATTPAHTRGGCMVAWLVVWR